MRKTISMLVFCILIALSLSGQTTSVLFLGNSYTGWNEMPLIFKQMAISNGDSIEVGGNVLGGYTLGYPGQGHLYNSASLNLIGRGNWDFVVLQEHSQFPVIPYYRDNYTFPSAEALDSIIQEENTCAQTVFFMTWGRKNGGEQCINSYCSPVFVDFFHMQDSLETAYMYMSLSNGAMCSPVGMCFAESIANGDPIELFDTDESHPSLAGSYLAACSFYAAIFLKSPVGIEYTAGLSGADAAYLQQIAEDVVLNDPAQWNIYPPEPFYASFIYEADETIVEFTNTTPNASFFQWNFGDPFSGSNNVSTLENPVHQFSTEGTYIVTLVAGDSCINDTAFAEVVVIETGIYETDEQQLIIFPNPVRDILNIYVGVPIDHLIYRITGMDGKSFLQGSLLIENKKAQITGLSVLSPGVYFLVLSGDKEKITRKIIVSP